MISKVIVFSTLCALSFASVLPPLYTNTENVGYYIEPYQNQEAEAYNAQFVSARPNEAILVPIIDEEYLVPVYEVSRYRRQAQNEGQRGSVSVEVGRTQRGGTDFNAEARAKLWESQNRRSTVEGNTFYQRHYGGQMGTQRPNYGGGITFTHRF